MEYRIVKGNNWRTICRSIRPDYTLLYWRNLTEKQRLVCQMEQNAGHGWIPISVEQLKERGSKIA